MSLLRVERRTSSIQCRQSPLSQFGVDDVTTYRALQGLPDKFWLLLTVTVTVTVIATAVKTSNLT
jgi:hypothetical protein